MDLYNQPHDPNRRHYEFARACMHLMPTKKGILSKQRLKRIRELHAFEEKGILTQAEWEKRVKERAIVQRK